MKKKKPVTLKINIRKFAKKASKSLAKAYKNIDKKKKKKEKVK